MRLLGEEWIRLAAKIRGRRTHSMCYFERATEKADFKRGHKMGNAQRRNGLRRIFCQWVLGSKGDAFAPRAKW